MELLAVVGGQFLHRGQDVGHMNEALVANHPLVVDHSIGATAFQGFDCKVITVERSTPQGEKHGVLRTVARIGRDNRMLEKHLIEF